MNVPDHALTAADGQILPLKQQSVEDKIFLPHSLWPAFGADGTALTLKPLRWLITTRHTIG